MNKIQEVSYQKQQGCPMADHFRRNLSP